MKNKKSIFAWIAVGSNLFVLSLVFNVYFSNTKHKTELYSSSSSLKSKVQKCKTEIEKVLNKSQDAYTCKLKKKKEKYKKTSYSREIKYSLETEIEITRQEDGEILIVSNGKLEDIKGFKTSLTDGNRALTEAVSCEDCLESERRVDQNSDLKNVLETVIAAAEKTKENAKDQLSDAMKEVVKDSNKKKVRRKIAKFKESQCFGEWDDSGEGEFILFTSKYEQLNCKVSQFSIMDFSEKDNFYHSKLKKDLWKHILNETDNDELSGKLREMISDPYSYSLSVRSSANLIDNFIHWKYLADEDPELAGLKDPIVGQIKSEAQVFTSFMTSQQKETDLDYLNQGLERYFTQKQSPLTQKQPYDTSSIRTTSPDPALTNPLPSNAPLKKLPAWNDVNHLY